MERLFKEYKRLDRPGVVLNNHDLQTVKKLACFVAEESHERRQGFIHGRRHVMCALCAAPIERVELSIMKDDRLLFVPGRLQRLRSVLIEEQELVLSTSMSVCRRLALVVSLSDDSGPQFLCEMVAKRLMVQRGVCGLHVFSLHERRPFCLLRPRC